MFFKMLKNDLRQKKALNFVLFLFTLRNGASLELQSAKLCGDNRKFVIPDNANNTTLKTKRILQPNQERRQKHQDQRMVRNPFLGKRGARRRVLGNLMTNIIKLREYRNNENKDPRFF